MFDLLCTLAMSSKFYPSFIPIYGYMVSGVRCQQSDDGEQKTEDSKGVSSSSFHHVFSVVWPLRWPGLNSEPQNIEYRTAELRRMVSLRSIFL